MTKLRHVSEGVLNTLRNTVDENIGRYIRDGFADQAAEPGWAIERNLEIDLEALGRLDGSSRSAELDLNNSRIVMEALRNLSPSLANEEQFWVRLSHVEAFEYSRDRWLSRSTSANVARDIRTHFFAKNLTGIRDDHALSRLWWNGFIARTCMPDNPDRGLEILLTSADVRSNLVERRWLLSRQCLATGVFKVMERYMDMVRNESAFREFMKTLNLRGGGVVFEAMSPSQVEVFVEGCVPK